MDTRSFLKTMRQGRQPSEEDLCSFVLGMTKGEVNNSQVAAFAMATCIHGIHEKGRVALTTAMRDSGEQLAWDLPGPILDKHSSGGIGDCTSLLLAAAVAACGAYVPMVSGRNLGYAGGTLDSLKSIPGVDVDLSKDRFKQVVSKVGCAIVSATQEIVPADRKLFAIRDVTSTVESVDLITASILSKKLATGIEGLVLDIKFGSGAFMKSVGAATGLARALVTTANELDCRCSAVLSDMNQPLARSIGGSLEMAEAMRVFQGDTSSRLAELTCALGGLLLKDAGMAEDEAAGREKIKNALSSGHAAEVFGKMIAEMGGPIDFVENSTAYIAKSAVVLDVTAKVNGFVSAIDGEALGMSVVNLGGGRRVEDAAIDRSVGVEAIARVGTPVEAGTVLARIHATDTNSAEQAARTIQEAIQISGQFPVCPNLVFKRISTDEYTK